jgi:hypothetical protein
LTLKITEISHYELKIKGFFCRDEKTSDFMLHGRKPNLITNLGTENIFY